MTVMERLELDLIDSKQQTAPDHEREWLRSGTRPEVLSSRRLTVVDLFAGCGAMTLGLWEAARRAGIGLDSRLGVEGHRATGDVYKRNAGGRLVVGNVARMFNGQPEGAATARETAIAASVGNLDILLGGPPCQGHSDLNNHTRRSDPKNSLYAKMARAAEVLSPRLVVIENVPPVQWDVGKVVDSTRSELQRLGFKTSAAVIDSVLAGVPQRRKRFILLGSKVAAIDPLQVLTSLASKSAAWRTVGWAIDDLEEVDSVEEIDQPSRLSKDNVQRIAYLTDTGATDLPNAQRPKCHRDDPTHSYKSMYGRLSWAKPAQTITTGFTSMGQGRFVHPSQPRTLTPHEAARLQTIPDWFDWGDAKRTLLSTMIGNAVPPLLMTALGSLIIPRLAEDERSRETQDK
jgi:DNA (cytosine-5)-methyltransferase 1